MCFSPNSSRLNFNPRPPRGGRLTDETLDELTGGFQSTPSARRATQDHPRHPDHRKISIHALREEGDQRRAGRKGGNAYFNPRPPRGGRQGAAPMRRPLFIISIHALREEGDVRCFIWYSFLQNFNPRPPRGGRHSICKLIRTELEFQSTPSARRATLHRGREGRQREDFNPRPPRGGRRASRSMGKVAHIFQSTPSARRATEEVLHGTV